MSNNPVEILIISDDGDLVGLRFREIAGRVFMDEYFRKKIPYLITALAINSNSFAIAGENKVCLYSKGKASFDYSGTYVDDITQVVTALEFIPQTQFDFELLIVGFGNGVLKIIEHNLVKYIWDKDKGHAGHRISSISAHSSGKIALTFSASSGILKTWDTEKKKLAFVVDLHSALLNLPVSELTFNENCGVKFSPDGQVFAVCSAEYILVIETLTGKTVAMHRMELIFNNFACLDSLRLLVADESGNVEIFSSLLEDPKIQLIEKPTMTPNTKVFCWDKKIVVARSFGELEIFIQKSDYIEEYCKYSFESNHISNVVILGSTNGRSYFYTPGDMSPDCEVLVHL